MIRIKKDECGYAGYTRIQLPALADAYCHAKHVQDTVQRRTTDFEEDFTDTSVYSVQPVPASVKWNWIDNYLNIPTMFATSAIGADTLLNMDTSKTVQETACMDCTYTADMYNYSSYHNVVTMRMSDVTAYSTLASVLLPRGTENTGTSVDPSHQELGEELTVFPAIVEPMIKTQLTADTLCVQTDADTALNSVVYAQLLLAKWRSNIDDRIRALSRAVPHIWGIRDLLQEVNNESCNSTLKTGASLSYTGLPENTPQYKVSGRSLTINGQAVAVSDLQTATAPFTAYVNVRLQNADSDGHYTSVTAETKTSMEGAVSIPVATVNRYSTPKRSGIPSYTLYKNECIQPSIDTDVVRTAKQGVLYKTSGTIPYKALDCAECDS